MKEYTYNKRKIKANRENQKVHTEQLKHAYTKAKDSKQKSAYSIPITDQWGL